MSKISRRSLLVAGGASTAAVLAGGTPAFAATGDQSWSRTGSPSGWKGDPFTLGVASGEPTPDGVVLWTRLAPDPLAEDGKGGMPDRDVEVDWEMATDEQFRRVVKRGRATAEADWAHSVHVDVGGLRSGAEFYYRFRVGGHVSPMGRTRTAPPENSNPAKLTLGVASCSMYEHGFFTSYRRMAEDDLDVILHLGDYIYEYGPGGYRSRTGTIRNHVGGETVTLADYRRRHAQYKTDTDLQLAHACAPWAVVWDDHELDNNWADEVPEDDQPLDAWLARRAAGMKAYWEHMPLSNASRPRGIDMQLYRSGSWGRLADVYMLDERQYRTDQPCNDGFGTPTCDAREDPAGTILGFEQEKWLADELARNDGRWTILGNQIFFTEVDYILGEEKGFYHDGWDGYPFSRQRVVDAIEAADVENLVILTGDYHRHYAVDVRTDITDPATSIGSEFVATSISAEGDGLIEDNYIGPYLSENPQVLFAYDQSGYLRCTATPDEFRCEFQALPYVTQPGAPSNTVATYVVENGRPGPQQA